MYGYCATRNDTRGCRFSDIQRTIFVRRLILEVGRIKKINKSEENLKFKILKGIIYFVESLSYTELGQRLGDFYEGCSSHFD